MTQDEVDAACPRDRVKSGVMVGAGTTATHVKVMSWELRECFDPSWRPGAGTVRNLFCGEAARSLYFAAPIYKQFQEALVSARDTRASVRVIVKSHRTVYGQNFTMLDAGDYTVRTFLQQQKLFVLTKNAGKRAAPEPGAICARPPCKFRRVASAADRQRLDPEVDASYLETLYARFWRALEGEHVVVKQPFTLTLPARASKLAADGSVAVPAATAMQYRPDAWHRRMDAVLEYKPRQPYDREVLKCERIAAFFPLVVLCYGQPAPPFETDAGKKDYLHADGLCAYVWKNGEELGRDFVLMCTDGGAVFFGRRRDLRDRRWCHPRLLRAYSAAAASQGT